MPRSRTRGGRLVRAALAAALLPLALLPGSAQAVAADSEAATVISRVDTDDPVVFLTVDGGWGTGNAAGAQRLLLERRVPASLFLLPGAYEREMDYYRTLLAHGPSRVENHTVSHPDLTTLGEAGQRAEICGARDRQLAAFGDSPRLLRPAGGPTYSWPYCNDDTLTAARACGAEAVVTWTHDFTTWGEWTPPTPRLRAGDIVLLHMGPQLEADLTRALEAAEAAGLEPANLREYALR
ncbi:polysaccharide deacetylase family protein [Streptomyces sp. MUM 203J]|uniref:polysaccharide deacetylase family protein n=1 Tax=Streptomyces sp. MUM 203J TaxID=2791990 RepID=UPI001F043D24|nr:polysaccharide deacetylase family protein [Streptomyces sp. MUM 203J]